MSAAKSKPCGTASVTVVNPEAVTPSSVAVAVMTAVCGPLRVKSAVIKPVVLKRGTAAELDAQMKLVMVVSSCPRASSAIASICIDPPRVRTGAGADTCTLARRRCTVTVTLDCDAPADAPMMAVPSPTAVTVAVPPVPVTVATAGLLVVHANVGDEVIAPLPSRTAAVTVRVSPADVIASVDEMVRLTDPFSGLVVLSWPAPHAASRLEQRTTRIVRAVVRRTTRGAKRGCMRERK